MVTLVKSPVMEKQKSLRVFLFGNNPSDLSNIYDQMTSIRKIKFITDYSFDFKNLLTRITKFNPDCLLIDDNMEKNDLKKLLSLLKGNQKTKRIPITIVQHTNRDDMPREGAEGFILKQTLTAESLLTTILSSMKAHDLQDYLKDSYSRRKRILVNK